MEKNIKSSAWYQRLNVPYPKIEYFSFIPYSIKSGQKVRMPLPPVLPRLQFNIRKKKILQGMNHSIVKTSADGFCKTRTT